MSDIVERLDADKLRALAQYAADATIPEDDERYTREKWLVARDAALYALSTPPPQAEDSTLPGEVVDTSDIEWWMGDAASILQCSGNETHSAKVRAVRDALIAARNTSPPTTPAVESGEASTANPLTALRAFVAAYKASDEPRSGAMYDAYLCGTIAVRAQS